MKLRGTEIGVWRIVLVITPHCRIAKQNAAATVRLQSVFVWVNNNRVRLPDSREARRGFLSEIRCQCKVPAVGSVGVNSKAVRLPQGKNLSQRIDGPGCGGAHRCNHGTRVAAG